MHKLGRPAWDSASHTSQGSQGSVSHASVTSRCSISSASSAAHVQQHESKLNEAFRNNNTEFLINLLGPQDTLAGFVRQKNMSMVSELIGNPSLLGCEVSRKDLMKITKTNWPEELSEVLRVYDSVVRRREVDSYFDKRAMDRDSLSNLLIVASGDRAVDRGLVFLYAECLRRDEFDMLVALISRFATSPDNTAKTAFIELHARSRVALVWDCVLTLAQLTLTNKIKKKQKKKTTQIGFLSHSVGKKNCQFETQRYSCEQN